MAKKKHKVDYTDWPQLTDAERQARISGGKYVATSERSIQIKLAGWLRETYPGIRFYSTLDGEIHGTKWAGLHAMRWYNQDHDGTGFPDFFVWAPNHLNTFLVIELKRVGVNTKGKSKHLSNQVDWLAYFQSIGAAAMFCVGLEEAQTTIKRYLRTCKRK